MTIQEMQSVQFARRKGILPKIVDLGISHKEGGTTIMVVERQMMEKTPKIQMLRWEQRKKNVAHVVKKDTVQRIAGMEKIQIKQTQEKPRWLLVQKTIKT